MLTSPVSSISPAQTVHQDPVLNSACFQLVSTMMDNLLHDARNPLNALSINIEVLSERLRRESGGALPPQHEKTLRTMREQVLRVDAIMKQFADYISPRPNTAETLDFSEAILTAITVIGHEGRKRRVDLRPMIDSGVKVKTRAQSGLSFLAIQPLARAIARSEPGAEVKITLRCEDKVAVFRVEDGAGEKSEPSPDAVYALRTFAEGFRGECHISAGVVEIRLPLA